MFVIAEWLRIRSRERALWDETTDDLVDHTSTVMEMSEHLSVFTLCSSIGLASPWVRPNALACMNRPFLFVYDFLLSVSCDQYSICKHYAI